MFASRRPEHGISLSAVGLRGRKRRLDYRESGICKTPDGWGPLDIDVTPDEAEIKLVGLLDSQGGLAVVDHVEPFMLLMVKAAAVEKRALFLTVILATRHPNCLSHFVDRGGLKVLKHWIKDAADNGRAELLLLLLDAVKDLPVTEEAVRGSEIGKTVKKLKKGGRRRPDPQVVQSVDTIITRWTSTMRRNTTVETESGCGDNSQGDAKDAGQDGLPFLLGAAHWKKPYRIGLGHETMSLVEGGLGIDRGGIRRGLDQDLWTDEVRLGYSASDKGGDTSGSEGGDRTSGLLSYGSFSFAGGSTGGVSSRTLSDSDIQHDLLGELLAAGKSKCAHDRVSKEQRPSGSAPPFLHVGENVGMLGVSSDCSNSSLISSSGGRTGVWGGVGGASGSDEALALLGKGSALEDSGSVSSTQGELGRVREGRATRTSLAGIAEIGSESLHDSGKSGHDSGSGWETWALPRRGCMRRAQSAVWHSVGFSEPRPTNIGLPRQGPFVGGGTGSLGVQESTRSSEVGGGLNGQVSVEGGQGRGLTSPDVSGDEEDSTWYDPGGQTVLTGSSGPECHSPSEVSSECGERESLFAGGAGSHDTVEQPVALKVLVDNALERESIGSDGTSGLYWGGGEGSQGTDCVQSLGDIVEGRQKDAAESRPPTIESFSARDEWPGKSNSRSLRRIKWADRQGNILRQIRIFDATADAMGDATGEEGEEEVLAKAVAGNYGSEAWEDLARREREQEREMLRKEREEAARVRADEQEAHRMALQRMAPNLTWVQPRLMKNCELSQYFLWSRETKEARNQKERTTTVTEAVYHGDATTPADPRGVNLCSDSDESEPSILPFEAKPGPEDVGLQGRKGRRLRERHPGANTLTHDCPNVSRR